MNITFSNINRIIINNLCVALLSINLFGCGGNDDAVWSNYEYRHVPSSNDEYYTPPQGYGGMSDYGGSNDSDYVQPNNCTPGSPDLCM
jgi:hypothetical protein